MNNRTKGIDGETLARDYLIAKGYKILEHNSRIKTGEVDIVAEDRGIIVFIEVKMRSSLQFGSPAEAINKTRIRRYINSAKLYINQHRLANRDIRFDVIEVIGDKVNHIPDAFRNE
jgi:putative endonuclease